VSDLRKAIAQAIYDPGATEGYKGERSLTDWQTDAVMSAIRIDLPINIAFSVAYLDGIMEYELPEIAKQWAVVRDHFVGPAAK
jgi:hypothetical protein